MNGQSTDASESANNPASTPITTPPPPIIEDIPIDEASLKKTVSSWFLVAGSLLVLVGGLTVFFPFVAAMAIEAVVGVGFLLAGITYAYNAFRNEQKKERIFGYVLAAIYSIGGILLFAAPMAGIEALALAMGAVLLIESLAKIIFSKKLSATNPGIWVVDGIIGVLIAAVVLTFWPEDSIWVVGLLIGMRIVFTGVILIFASRKVQSGALSDIIPESTVVDGASASE